MARHFADILIEIADGDAPFDGDLPLVGLLLAVDHPEDGRLTGAVRADEADLLASVKSRGRLDEEDAVTELLADIFNTDHDLRGSLEKEILARLCHAGKSQDSPVSDRLDLKSMMPKGVSGFRANMLAFFNLEPDWILSRLTPTETCANERSSAAVLQTIRAE